MARYIDADKLINYLKDLQKPQDIGFNEESIMVSINLKSLVEKIESLPTADVEEVVRCKDCVHYKPFLHKKNRKYCFKFDHTTTAEEFCSFAERRKDEVH